MSISDTTNKENLLLLAQLRWFAVVGQVAAIGYAHFALGISLPLSNMAAVVIVLVCLNIFSLYLHRAQDSVLNWELFLALLVDAGALTAQLYFSGGVTNPFITLYLVQVALGAILLEAWSAWTLVVFTGLCFVWLTFLHENLVIAVEHGGTLGDLHVQGFLICFILGASLIVLFTTRISRNLSARDLYLADLRQHSVEEDHIVRLGLLASGAAHELGTPLATLSVILNDWQHMPELIAIADIGEEIAEMQSQVERCKSILSGILMSSGEARGEGTVRTTIGAFFDEVADDWRISRTPSTFIFRFEADRAIPMVSDAALKQILFNVLDNALEASPNWVRLTVEVDNERIVISVSDRGPGFAPEMLAAFGKPYHSSKSRPGRGLGLFLVVNVVRKLGGTVVAENADTTTNDTGARLTIVLPLTAITTNTSAGGREWTA